MATPIDDLVAEIESQTTVIAGIGVLIQGLQDEVRAAKGNEVKIAAAFDKAKANTAALAEAVVDNTPNETPAEPPPAG